MSSNILRNLADSYPQAPIEGGTPRMKEAINPTNKVEDDKYDLICTLNIKIGQFMEGAGWEKKTREDQDYT